MTCAARLKLNNPITSATTLARMTRLRIYRPKPLEGGPRCYGRGQQNPAPIATILSCICRHDTFMAAVPAHIFFSKLLFQPIWQQRNFASFSPEFLVLTMALRAHSSVTTTYRRCAGAF
jgi:hypothetical protein